MKEYMKEWANDNCPAVSLYNRTGKVSEGLLAEAESLIRRQARHMGTPHVDSDRAHESLLRLLNFRTYVKDVLVKKKQAETAKS